MPDWLAPQANLISVPAFNEAFVPIVVPAPPEGDDDDDDSAGPVEYGCLYDHDLDMIADVDESAPIALSDQIRLRQAQNLLLDPEFYADFAATPELNTLYNFEFPWFDAGFIDIDSNEDPDDEFATAIPEYNIGGRAAETGEEAVWIGTLPAGEYIIIVGGADGSAGPYLLSVKVIQ
jgi:hypothetical protein